MIDIQTGEIGVYEDKLQRVEAYDTLWDYSGSTITGYFGTGELLKNVTVPNVIKKKDGTYTYGKGTVQTTKNLETSKGMIKYTIQKWLSPNGNWINKKGVEPTVSVELSSSYENNPTEANDNQLQKALNVVANK